MNLRDVKYRLRHKGDKIIFVDPTIILDRLENTWQNIRNSNNQIGGRILKAKEFILKNWDNPRAKILPMFEASVVGIYNGGISFEDGRHRILAAEQLGIPEVAIEIPRRQEPLFEYMKVKKPELQLKESPDYKLNESPDKIKNGILHDYTWMAGQALPFSCIKENNKLKVLVGDWGQTHRYISKDDTVEPIDKKDRLYSGRLWVGEKIISFWSYPNKKDFNEIINQLEPLLLRKIKTNISNKIWNNGWQVEIISLKNKFKINKNYQKGFNINPDNFTSELIPVEDYLKSEDFPEELKQKHIMERKRITETIFWFRLGFR